VRRATRYDPHVDRLREAARETPPEARSYAEKVRDDPHTVTDEDIEALKQLGLSEDEIFEHSVAAAVGAGLERLEIALRVLE
jgi:alkylhydroperoxidase family enzyme